MSEYKSEITGDEYLKALALFTMANGHYVQSCTFADLLNRLIMNEPKKFPGGHIDDAIYSDERATVDDFDEALRREGIKVLDTAVPNIGDDK